MRIRFDRQAATIAVAAFAVVLAACDDGGTGEFGGLSSSVRPSPVAGESDESSLRLTAEPRTVVPELLPRGDCLTLPAFRTRFAISIRAGRAALIRGIGFDFVDSFGDRQFPTIIAGSPAASSIPRSTPAPLPTAPPIPLPGTPAAFPGVAVEPDRTMSFPFALDFACGVPASGTIFVLVETGDRGGSSQVLRTHIRVRG
ncbi:MAG TPA: hypothetical protein VNK41_00200 [Vicinamibacterales bacterium]|nr:hypothetical protein [Vicinamibacterales bacterium]